MAQEETALWVAVIPALLATITAVITVYIKKADKSKVDTKAETTVVESLATRIGELEGHLESSLALIAKQQRMIYRREVALIKANILIPEDTGPVPHIR